MTLKIDKELYKQAQEYYRQWNEEKLRHRINEERQLSPEDAWRRFAGLWEFARKLAPPRTELQDQQWLADWEDYFAKVRKLEAWRRARGKEA